MIVTPHSACWWSAPVNFRRCTPFNRPTLTPGSHGPPPARFPAKFCEALAARLAVDASGPLIGQAGMNNRGPLLQEYELAKNSAAVHDYNEGRTADWYETPSLVARG